MGLDDFELEPSEHEPEEWDPESDLHDPDAPGLTIPAVETDETDAPKEVVETFWITVLVVNVAVFCVAVGPMLIYFEGWIREGAAMVIAGIALFGLAYRRYRAFMQGPPPEVDSNVADASSTPARSSESEASSADTHDRSDSSDSTDTHEDSS
ncbi:DUF7322 domain-containing protein [Halovivax limisalsi]|uniref:DUF7322 domain-containing protein n=1 Tax=Halovivax limisalsi TaxID=1453760 RepID=UPI001FFC51E4|nr:CAAX protease family protein [Halovivax limisalsi]